MLERKDSSSFKERLLQRQPSENRSTQGDQGELQDDTPMKDEPDEELASEELLAQKDCDWNALHSSGILSSEHVSLEREQRGLRSCYRNVE